MSNCHERAGQTGFGHFVNTLSFGLTVSVLQNGHRAGGRGFGGRPLRSTTCGAGESPGLKLQKAERLGVAVLDEVALREAVGQ